MYKSRSDYGVAYWHDAKLLKRIRKKGRVL